MGIKIKLTQRNEVIHNVKKLQKSQFFSKCEKEKSPTREGVGDTTR